MNLHDLNKVNREQIARAGARYTPALDPNAPNLEIAPLVESFDALTVSEKFRQHLENLSNSISSQWQKASKPAVRAFSGRVQSPKRLVAMLDALRESRVENIGINNGAIARCIDFVGQKIQTCRSQLLENYPDQSDYSENAQRRRGEIDKLSELAAVIEQTDEYVRSSAFQLIDNKSAFLRGPWGTGKTHFMCDITASRMAMNLPTLLLLAHHIPANKSLLTEICRSTGLATNKRDLLRGLQRMGKAAGVRTIVLIDGINEAANREVWRSALPALAREIQRYSHVSLAVSCRDPFHILFLTPAARQQFVILTHPGFSEIEFDAQTAFFEFYNIPIPQFPLLSEEFARPLFLKIVCETFRDMEAGRVKRHLRQIASGQKGMTHVLEKFIDRIGVRVEGDFQLAGGTCWKILKGARPPGFNHDVGLAVLMADGPRDYVTVDECLNVMQSHAGYVNCEEARPLLDRCLVEGLLQEDIVWSGSEIINVVRLPYQKFSDHLIARHLLAAHLDVGSTERLRRCFYSNRPLGAVFNTKNSPYSYALPGIASAIMLEFPERVKRLPAERERELVFYLPRRARILSPLVDPFLEGLAWRSRSAFTSHTDHIVSELLSRGSDYVARKVFEMLVCLATRAGHPYAADRLYGYLEQQNMPDRDIRWGEFLRQSPSSSAVFRLLDWIERASDLKLDRAVILNSMRLLTTFLTTTRRALRDRATRALVTLGGMRPDLLFDLTRQTLKFDDIYVPERALAACYGVVMRHWSDRRNRRLRRTIVPFTSTLYREIFAPNADHGTRHELVRDYALGIISLGRKIAPNCIATRNVKHLKPPFDQLPRPFPEADRISEADCEVVGKHLMMPDFENYTIGSLVSNRHNHQMDHPEYMSVLRQIKWRMANLGYTRARFHDVDREIDASSYRREAESGARIDRYCKKYGWIAYFEAYGLRKDLGLVVGDSEEPRLSDCDIDPSFPSAPRVWIPNLPNLFDAPYADPADWLTHGPEPNYRSLLQVLEVDGMQGPWILLQGFIAEKALQDPREIFCFLRGLLVDPTKVAKLEALIDAPEYPGNRSIPEPWHDLYTFGGEIPWSPRYGSGLRNRRGRTRRHLEEALGQTEYRQVLRRLTPEELDAQVTADERFATLIASLANLGLSTAGRVGRNVDDVPAGFVRENRSKHYPGVKVEIPSYQFAWESYHSTINQVSSVDYPAPAICDALGLIRLGAGADLFDQSGRAASLCIQFGEDDSWRRSKMLYLRQDLLDRYLRETGQTLVWVNWGERSLHHEELQRLRDALQDVWAGHQHVHKVYLRYE